MGLEARLAWRWAYTLQKEIVAAAVEALKGLGKSSRLSGSDSGLETVWEEICAQVQGEESYYWGAYVSVIDQAVEAAFNRRTPDEQLIVWLQTNEGCDWLDDNEQEEQTFGELEDLLKQGYTAVCADDVAEHLREDLLEVAGTFTNENIERYLYGGEDDSEDENEEEDEVEGED